MAYRCHTSLTGYRPAGAEPVVRRTRHQSGGQQLRMQLRIHPSEGTIPIHRWRGIQLMEVIVARHGVRELAHPVRVISARIYMHEAGVKTQPALEDATIPETQQHTVQLLRSRPLRDEIHCLVLHV